MLAINVKGSTKPTRASIYFEDALSGALIKKGVRMVDRKHLEKIQKEIRMSMTDLVDEEEVVELGKVAGAKTMITGNLFTWDEGVKFQIRAIDVASSQIVFQDGSQFQPSAAFKKLLGAGH